MMISIVYFDVPLLKHHYYEHNCRRDCVSSSSRYDYYCYCCCYYYGFSADAVDSLGLVDWAMVSNGWKFHVRPVVMTL